jgi:NAD(P)-dependent dehydrogenase (short-subunit alcohol dehydrogenase family)
MSQVDALAGKVAFVTGAAGGIGLGIARACVDSGMKVVIADIDATMLEDAAEDLRRRADATVMAVVLDVTDRARWAEVARQVAAEMGPVQLLVNNAGVSTLGVPFEEVTPELWDRVVAINLTGVFNGMHAFVETMRGAGGGHIVNTSSMGGFFAGARLAPYAATKSAVVALSEALRHEFADSGIGVSVLCPGSVRTRLWRTSRAMRGLPDRETPPPELTGGSADPSGMDPDEVGRRVLAGVRANDLYIFTHTRYREGMEDRHRRLLEGFDRAAAFVD